MQPTENQKNAKHQYVN